MTVALPARRWTLSFADLCLVLVAVMAALYANRAAPVAQAAGIRAAFGAPAPAVAERGAAALFEPGEALLRASARADFKALGRRAAAAGSRVSVESIGRDAGARRFDGWELAAARTAAVARAVAAGGLDPARIDVALGGTRSAGGAAGQRLRITTVPPSA